MSGSFPNGQPKGLDARETRERVTTHIPSDFEDIEGNHPDVEIDLKAPGLFLFDIDGTLIDATRLHAPAAIALYKEMFGNEYGFKFGDEDFEREFIRIYASRWGLGDRQEFEMLCNDYGVVFKSPQEKEATLDELVLKYSTKIEEAAREAAKDEEMVKSIILPGVLPFLEEMRARKIPAALVTGNTTRSAHAFMKYLGLGKYFITGGFDDDAGITDEPLRRANIFKSALEKCRQKGLVLPENVAVFGDTPKDLLATGHGTEGMKPHVFLFATGTYKIEELTDTKVEHENRGAQLALPSFKNVRPKAFFDSVERYAAGQAK